MGHSLKLWDHFLELYSVEWDDSASLFYFVSWIWMDLWMFWCQLWLCVRPPLSFLIFSTVLLTGAPPVWIFKNLSAKGLKSQLLSCFSERYLRKFECHLPRWRCYKLFCWQGLLRVILPDITLYCLTWTIFN